LGRSALACFHGLKMQAKASAPFYITLNLMAVTLEHGNYKQSRELGSEKNGC